MKISNVLNLIFIFFSFSQLLAQECYPTIYKGEGTYYDGIAGTSSGNCSLPVADGDYFHCAINDFMYNNSEACGACVIVTGPKGSITLQVVDRCPECASGDIDMTEEAFSQIADVVDGRVPITWKYTTCENNINNNIQIVFKEGSSEFWTGVQFRNSTHAIASMEYQLTNGNWNAVTSEEYNYFIASEGISSPMNLRVTSVLGDQLVFENINLINSVEINSNLQFSTTENCIDSTLSSDSFDKINYTILSSEGKLITSISSKSKLLNIKDIQLYNLMGQKIAITTIVNNENNIIVNTKNIDKGIYIITLQENNNTITTKKIII